MQLKLKKNIYIFLELNLLVILIQFYLNYKEIILFLKMQFILFINILFL